ncbi:GNAT family N-acetyltransferase [Alphaproteobacteria bacterium]|nr:GNAT family N-acetyltransferase [Alphaproteobacteria bacterium]
MRMLDVAAGNIRVAIPSDASAIAEVYVETWRAAYAGILPDRTLVRMSVASQIRQWQSLLNAGDAVLVVTDGAEIVGFGGYGPNRERNLPYSGEVYTLYVSPDYQNQGLGSRLLRAMFKALQRDGHESAIIWVLAENPSRFFYECEGGAKIADRNEFLWGVSVRELGYGWSFLSLGVA